MSHQVGPIAVIADGTGYTVFPITELPRSVMLKSGRREGAWCGSAFEPEAVVSLWAVKQPVLLVVALVSTNFCLQCSHNQYFRDGNAVSVHLAAAIVGY